METYFAQQHHIIALISGQTPGHSIMDTSASAERVSAATLARMIRQKETFLLALCTHIATHTRHWERQGLRLCAKAPRLPAPLSVVVRPPLSDIRVAVLRVDRPPV